MSVLLKSEQWVIKTCCHLTKLQLPDITSAKTEQLQNHIEIQMDYPREETKPNHKLKHFLI